MNSFDAVVIGAGAAGLYGAAQAGRRGLRVLLVDHAAKVAEKIRISGGGRCNFTNLHCGPANFHSSNPDFCRSALARHTPGDFVALVRRHGIGFHEKHQGQLFCDDSSERIIAMLLAECADAKVERWQPCEASEVRHLGDGWRIDTPRGMVHARSLVVATGGLSIPRIGASDFGYRLARQFGHRIVEPRPALVPLTFDAETWRDFAALAGVSIAAAIEVGEGRGRTRFEDDLLFTHRGLSGPVVLQASSLWRPATPLTIDLAPRLDLLASLLQAKRESNRRLGNALGQWLPQRLADAWIARLALPAERPMSQVRDRDLEQLAQALTHWELTPSGTEGFRKAEVTAGGVDTRELDSRTMASRRRPGLYFIGEVVDVTGWLGGHNFQWAWSSAAACAAALPGG